MGSEAQAPGARGIIEVVDAAGRPVEDARARALDARLEEREVRALGGGRFLLEGDGECVLELTAGGFAPQLEHVEPRDGDPLRIELRAPLAVLELLCLREGSDEPVEGVELTLLVPEEARGARGEGGVLRGRLFSPGPRDAPRGSREAAFRALRARQRVVEHEPGEPARTTGADGRAVWSGLLPAQGYRYRARSLLLLPEPPGDTPPFERRDGGWVASSRGASLAGASGAFALHEGCLRLTARVQAVAHLEGRVVDEGGAPLAGAQVRVQHCGVVEEDGASMHVMRFEGQTESDGGGRFELRDLLPGRKLLNATLGRREDDLLLHQYFASHAADLEVGEVGSVELRPRGRPLRFAVVHRDARSGRTLAPDEVYDDEQIAVAIELQIDSHPDGVGPASLTTGPEAYAANHLQAPPGLPLWGEPVVVHGLGWRLYTLWRGELPPPRDPWRLAPAPRSVELRPGTEPVEVVVEHVPAPATTITLRARAPAGYESGTLSAWIVPGDPEGEIESCRARGSFTKDVRLHAGDHELVVVEQSWRGREIRGLQGRARFHVEHGREDVVELDLRDGLWIEGTVDDSSGRLRVGRGWIAASPRKLAERDLWILSADIGSFRMPSVPPRSTIVFRGAGEPPAPLTVGDDHVMGHRVVR